MKGIQRIISNLEGRHISEFFSGDDIECISFEFQIKI